LTPCEGAPAVGELDRAEQLLLEPVGAALVELLVRRAEGGERAAELVGRARDRVEELLARFAGSVGHPYGGYARSL
jgi:hypothetical protein